ncbi:RNA polymerase II-associated protein 1 C-terminal domain-containing protein [Entamoeba marina]
MKANTILTSCTHEDDCPHCRQKRLKQKTLPDIKEKPVQSTRKPTFNIGGFPKPQKKYQPKKKKENVASKETVDFIKMLHSGHSCDVSNKNISANASWMGNVETPKVFPEITINNMRLGFAGEVLPFNVDLSPVNGLYNHGEDAWAAGYTLNEIGMLLRSNVTPQVRAMLGIVEAIHDRCLGINRTISYTTNEGTPVTFGGDFYGDNMYYKDISKELLFESLWLKNDVFASLCELVLSKTTTILTVAIGVLYKLVISSPPESLNYRAAMKHYFQEVKDEEKEDVVQRYLSLGIIGKLIEYVKILPKQTAIQALWIIIGFFRLGKDYQQFIQEDDKKQLVAQLSQKKSTTSLNIGYDTSQKALAMYIATNPDVMPFEIDEDWDVVEEISRGWIPETGKVLLMTSLIRNKSLEIENPNVLHQASVKGAIGYEFLKETIPLLTTDELQLIYDKCCYNDLYSALLCVAYASELLRRKEKLKKQFLFNDNLFTDPHHFQPIPKNFYQIFPTCEWNNSFPYYQLLLCSYMSGSTPKKLGYDWNELGSPAEGCCLSVLGDRYDIVVKHLSDICITFGIDSFTIIISYILYKYKLRNTELESYYLKHFISKFTQVTIQEAFPNYPDVLSIGFCSQNSLIIKQTFQLMIHILPFYSNGLLIHYTSVLNILNTPEPIHSIDMSLINSYIETFTNVSKDINFDYLKPAKDEIQRELAKRSGTDKFADDDIMLLQQSKEYQMMFNYITLYNQTSLNHPLLSYLILPFYHPSQSFLDALKYSIGSFGAVYPFSKSIYLKQSLNNEYISNAITIFKTSKRWNDVIAASISYTIVCEINEDSFTADFYKLTQQELTQLKNVTNSIFPNTFE